MTVPEVIAYLDALERDIERMAGEVRNIKYLLFEGLDKDPDALVD